MNTACRRLIVASAIAAVIPLAAGLCRADEMPSPSDAPPPKPVTPILPAPRSRGALVLEGNLRNETIDCAGRDVLVHGDGGRYRLTNGCRGVSVQGRGNNIEAELQPGARIAIGGADVMLRYVMVAPGPPPFLSVTATNSRAIRVDHLGGAAEGADPARP